MIPTTAAFVHIQLYAPMSQSLATIGMVASTVTNVNLIMTILFVWTVMFISTICQFSSNAMRVTSYLYIVSVNVYTGFIFSCAVMVVCMVLSIISVNCTYFKEADEGRGGEQLKIVTMRKRKMTI